jgi:hypothetical protein
MPLLTLKSAALELGISERTVRRVMEGGELVYVEITPSCKRIDPSEIDAFRRRKSKCHAEVRVTGGTVKRTVGGLGSLTVKEDSHIGRALGLSGKNGRSKSMLRTSGRKPLTEFSDGKIVSLPTR